MKKIIYILLYCIIIAGCRQNDNPILTVDDFIEKELGKELAEYTQTDFSSITELQITGNIKTLVGIEKLVNLDSLLLVDS